MSPSAARMFVLLTGFIAFTSVLVAGLLALRLERSRDALQRQLQACTCCEDPRGER